MMRLCLLLMLLFCRPSFSKLNDTKVHKIHKFVRHISGATQHGVDVIDVIRHVAINSRHFIRLAGPVGALVAIAMEVTFDVKSDEQMALELLSSKMEHSFQVMAAQITQVQRVIIHVILSEGYSTAVTGKISKLTTLLRAATNPKGGRDKAKNSFTERCSSSEGPKGILDDLERIYIKRCPIPGSTDLKNYARVRSAFRDYEDRVGDMDGELRKKYLDAKSRVLQVLIGLNSRKAVEIVEKIRSTYATSQRAVEDLIHSLIEDNDMNVSDSCIMAAVLSANDDERRYLFDDVKLVTIDLLKTQYLLMACANSTVKGDPVAIEEWEQFGTVMVQRIANHIAEYAETLLIRAFPDVIAHWTEQAIGPGPVEKDNYNFTATLISKKLESRGPKTIPYQILLSEDLEVKKEFWVILAEKATYTRVSKSGLLVHLVGFEGGPEVRAANASDWFQKEEKELRNIIFEDMGSLTSAEAMLNTLEKDQGPLVADDRYRVAILLKRKAYTGSSAQIPTGEDFLTVVNSNATSSVYCYVNPKIWSAHEVKLYWFL